jgi:23S rRNA (cytidine1920-2'-O)/16S rRNA (cytidine1409-2'-O)-methyltransferase
MRLDLFLVDKALVDSRQRAQRLIKNGCVSVDGKLLTKPSEDIDSSSEHLIEITETDDERYVSRGGLKLEGALSAFGISPKGMICADIGASTGGFTDCLLQNGAEKVYAFDSGSGQLHSKLKSDKRVISKEGFNARYIVLSDVGEKVDMVVMDVSFISQTIIIPAIVKLLRENGIFLTLIKPQFEAGRSALGKNGIVKHKEDRLMAVKRVLDCARENGLSLGGLIHSPIKGGDGNEEFLAVFKLSSGDEPLSGLDIKNIVYEK